MGLLSTEKDVLWRSSPTLFDNDESESESSGRIRKNRRQSGGGLSHVSPTPSARTRSLSGVESLDYIQWGPGAGTSLYTIITGEELNIYISKYTSEWLSFYVRARSGTERPEVSEGSDERGRVPEA
nr:MAG: ORF3 [Torque teno polar bear virus 48]